MPCSLNFAPQPISKLTARHRTVLQPKNSSWRKPATPKPRVLSRPSPVNVFVTSAEANGAQDPICTWSVQVVQDWNAVKNLVKVSSVAAEVFYEGEGVQPIIDFSKLTYSIELLLRLGWRVGKLGSTSCFAIAHATGCSYSYKGFAGILEMSIQTDIPAELSGGSNQAAVVTTMAVMPRLQRQGIGSALLDAAERWAAGHGVEVVALFVYRDNDAAIRLYERRGFVRALKWVDPAWLACAEKGVIGPTRRVLYIKRLPSISPKACR
ncbi:hypothetical protein ABBQ32_008221 [Trebouxia sp. C0010 RCD-2024]